VSEPERIAIVDLADDLQVRKQRIFKILPRLGIRPTQRRELSRGNQNVATVSQSEAIAIRAEIEKSAGTPSETSSLSGSPAAFYSDDVGFFYLIQLEPEHDPGRSSSGSPWISTAGSKSTVAQPPSPITSAPGPASACGSARRSTA